MPVKNWKNDSVQASEGQDEAVPEAGPQLLVCPRECEKADFRVAPKHSNRRQAHAFGPPGVPASVGKAEATHWEVSLESEDSISSLCGFPAQCLEANLVPSQSQGSQL